MARVSWQFRPSAVSSALDTLEEGREKKCEYCKSFFVFGLGEACIQAATDIVERNAGDLVAESTWKKAVAKASFTEAAELKAMMDVGRATARGDDLDECAGKILSALSTWSSARTEEMWATVSAFVFSSLLSEIRHTFGMAIKILFQTAGTNMQEADAQGSEWAHKGFVDCGEKAKAVESLQKAVVSVQGVAKDIGSLVAYGQGRVQAMRGFHMKIGDVAKVGQKQRQEWAQDHRAPQHMCMWSLLGTQEGNAFRS